MMLRLLIKSIAFSDSDQITFSLSTFFFITFFLSRIVHLTGGHLVQLPNHWLIIGLWPINLSLTTQLNVS